MLISFYSSLRVIVILLVISFPLSVFALDIAVKGLFKNGAVMEIDGRQRMLKVGKRSPEGVLLVSSSTKAAEVEIGGQRKTLYLSRQISSRFTVPEKKTVAIPMSQGRSYIAGGRINGQSVEMIVDTGATSVALNSRQAKQLGIRYYEQGKRGKVRTASGLAEAYYLTLESVGVGGIVIHQVPGVVIIGEYPKHILLGMSYLRRVSMREESGILYLEQK